MPWKECSAMSVREEFVALASSPDACMSVPCRRFGVSRKTGYKWVARFKAGGSAALADRSRRPHSSPGRTDEALAAKVVRLRREHRAWGGRKIRRRPSGPGVSAVLRPRAVGRRHAGAGGGRDDEPRSVSPPAERGSPPRGAGG